jgi:DnaJ-class molecular chaperone
MSEIHTHYKRLNIEINATDDEIYEAYNSLIKKYNPDNFNGEEKDKFIRIKKSYEILMDPVKRSEHDSWIRMQEDSNSDIEHSNTTKITDVKNLPNNTNLNKKLTTSESILGIIFGIGAAVFLKNLDNFKKIINHSDHHIIIETAFESLFDFKECNISNDLKYTCIVTNKTDYDIKSSSFTVVPYRKDGVRLDSVYSFPFNGMRSKESVEMQMMMHYPISDVATIKIIPRT